MRCRQSHAGAVKRNRLAHMLDATPRRARVGLTIKRGAVRWRIASAGRDFGEICSANLASVGLFSVDFGPRVLIVADQVRSLRVTGNVLGGRLANTA